MRRLGLLLGLLAGCGRPALATLTQTPEATSIALTESGVRVDFAQPGFAVQVADPHRPYYLLANDKSGLNVSFAFDRPVACRTSRECRDLAVEKLGALNVSVVELEGISVSEHTEPRQGGIDLRQHHMHAHFVTERTWLHVHLSKVMYDPAVDRELFRRALEAIRISEGSR
jgi:hypothetical protein